MDSEKMERGKRLQEGMALWNRNVYALKSALECRDRSLTKFFLKKDESQKRAGFVTAKITGRRYDCLDEELEIDRGMVEAMLEYAIKRRDELAKEFDEL